MKERRRTETVGVWLALLMSAAALGLEIQRRLCALSVPAQTPSNAPMQSVRHGTTALPEAPPGAKAVQGADGEPIRMQGFKGGRKQYELTLDRLVLGQGEQAVTGEGAQGVLLGPNGKPTVRFFAERATMDRVTQNVEIQGLVRVESTDPKNPVAFQTRDMRWIAHEERLICPNPVKVVQPGITLYANRMTADVKLKQLVLEGGFRLEADSDVVKQRWEAMQKESNAAGPVTSSTSTRKSR